VSLPRGTVIVVGPHDESMVLNQLLRQNSVEGILKEEVQCYFIVITISILFSAMDMDGVDATNDVAVFELLVHHLEIMLYYLNEGNFLVQHNGLFKLGGDHSTSLVELLAFNLIICNWVTVRFNVKAQNERVVDLCQWMTSKEMSPDSARSMQNKKDLIKQFVMVILVHLELELDNLGKALLVGKSLSYLLKCSKFCTFLGYVYEAVTCCLLMVCYELRKKLQSFMLGEKVTRQPLIPSSIYVWCILVPSTCCIYPKQGSLDNERIMSLSYSGPIRQWDPGELKFHMIVTTCVYGWNGLISFHGLLNFVFDRGKFDGFKFSTLRTRLI
jgi:hypothetical protein